MKIMALNNTIQYNNNGLKNNTDTKLQYNNTSDIQQGSFVKSTPSKPTNAQNVSFGGAASSYVSACNALKRVQANLEKFLKRNSLENINNSKELSDEYNRLLNEEYVCSSNVDKFLNDMFFESSNG